MRRYITSIMRVVTRVMLGLSVVSLPALAQVAVSGSDGNGNNQGISFGDVQVNTTKVMTITLTTDDTVTFANPAVITSTLSGTPFSLVAGDDGCATKPVLTAGSCTIAVRFTPTAETNSASYFRVAATAPAGYPGIFVNLTGKGITGGASTAGTLSITPASGFTISASLSDIPTQILTLSATGGNVSIGGLALPDQWVANNLCGDSIRPGYDCVIMLKPDVPTNAGTYPYKVVIQASDRAHVIDVTLNVSETSSGVQGSLSVSPPSLDFGTLRPGESMDKTVTITASGANVAFTGLSVPDGFAVTHSCGTLIPAGGTCTAAITFLPIKEVSYAGSAVINSSGQGAPHFVSLSGSGSAASSQQSLLTVAPSTLNFGTLRPGARQTQSVSITASGTNVTLDGITPPTGFTVEHSCGALIPAGTTCSASVTFAPTAKIPYNGSVIIEIPDSVQFFTVMGSGGDTSSSSGGTTGGTTGGIPMLVIDDALLDFGSVATGSSSEKSMSLANRGGGELNAILTLVGSGFSLGSSGCLSGDRVVLAAGATCSLIVSFIPASIGAQSGRIDFTGSGATDIAITLRGAGLGGGSSTGSTVSNTGLGSTAANAGLVTASTNLPFGAVAVGGSAVKTLTLTTTNGSRPAIASVQVPSGYVASHDCATAATASCTLTLLLAPTAEITYQGLVVISATDGAALFLTVSGQGSAAAQMTARTRGSNQAIDMTGVFRFAAEQASRAGNLYVAVLYQDRLYFLSGGRWTLYVEGVEPPAYMSTAAQSNELTILSNQDVSMLSGGVVFLAYGRDFAEVRGQRQYTPVFVVD